MKTKKIYFSIIAISITFTISSCSNYNNGYKTSSEKANYIKTAEEKYSENINYIFSPDSAFIVCYSTEKQTVDNNIPQSKFFVYDLKRDKTIFEDNSRTDQIEWISNNELKVLKRPGIISVDQDINSKLLGYIYNIKNNQKLPLTKPTNDKSQ